MTWEPMLPTPGTLPSNSEAYAYELKWDGMRALARIKAGTLRIWSRHQVAQEARFPELAGMAGLPDIELDGEIVVLGADGRPDFSRLQHRFNLTRPDAIRRQAARHPAHFIAFDVLTHAGEDLRSQPYAKRRGLLERLALAGDSWATTPTTRDGAGLLASVRALGLEGVVAKKLNSTYRPGRRDTWVKVRNRSRQEFVVGGWVDGERPGSFGGLLVGHWAEGRLRFDGCVDVGYSRDDVRALRSLLRAQAPDTNPFGAGLTGAHFVEPGIVVEAEFLGLTAHGQLRHPSFKGIRSDKAADAVVWDQAYSSG